MQLREHATATAFLEDAGPYLEAREVENSLILGAALAVALSSGAGYGVTLRQRGKVVAAAFYASPFPLLLAATDDAADRAAELVLRAVRDAGTPPVAVVARAPVARAFADAWTAAGGEARTGMEQRLYSLDRVEPVPLPAGALRPAVERDVEVVARWMTRFEEEALGTADEARVRATVERRVGAGEFFLWVDGGVVAMAARARPTRHTATVNAVYTPPELRGRGYATGVVAALSQRLLDEGRSHCVLFTDRANPTSNRIYTRIGYRPVCDFTLFHLSGPG